MNPGRLLTILGVSLFITGAILYAGPSLPFLGKLPGDLRIERQGFHLYIPITTSLLISAALTALLWLFSKLR